MALRAGGARRDVVRGFCGAAVLVGGERRGRRVAAVAVAARRVTFVEGGRTRVRRGGGGTGEHAEIGSGLVTGLTAAHRGRHRCVTRDREGGRADAQGFVPTTRSRVALDQLELAFLGIYFLAAGLIFYWNYRHTRSGVLRQQLKWLTGGTLAGSLPFTVFFILPFIFD